MKKNLIRLSIFITTGLGLVSAAQATTPSELSDLVGIKASYGESEMISRGYKNIRTSRSEDRAWAYWFNDSTNTCVTVAIYNGRYNAITDSPYDCGEAAANSHTSSSQKHHSDAATVAGAALAIGAVAALAKYEHDHNKRSESYEIPQEIKNLEGARANSADTVFRNYNYHIANGSTDYDSKTNYWWNASKNSCIAAVTYNGRIDTVNKVNSSECE
ncbi:hypothetical protein [Acinetobacter johnsonii]|uniref:hypothetical protein n=1 Tax=Acinetobacter johnsonii TaxID=40214 RepID=UPI00143C3ECC|nr:hypothetical protein [Acinetobacter johnsonii]NKG36482.1 hypothetical protein [Acinetobacter johnsonii]